MKLLSGFLAGGPEVECPGRHRLRIPPSNRNFNIFSPSEGIEHSSTGVSSDQEFISFFLRDSGRSSRKG
jgi:hypothetical protein